MIKPIKYKDEVFGYIISYKKKIGSNFLTHPSLPNQIGSIIHKKNHEIKPHIHFRNLRKIEYTSEVLIILKGKIRVDLYNNRKKYLFSKIVKKGEILLLIKGAHGFKALSDIELIEVKQGPYNKTKDKILFDIDISKKIKIK